MRLRRQARVAGSEPWLRLRDPLVTQRTFVSASASCWGWGGSSERRCPSGPLVGCQPADSEPLAGITATSITRPAGVHPASGARAPGASRSASWAAWPHAVVHCALWCSRRSGACLAIQSSGRPGRWQAHLAAQATPQARAGTGGKHVAYAACVIGVFAVGTALCMQEACRLPERWCCTEHYVQARASCTCGSSYHSWETHGDRPCFFFFFFWGVFPFAHLPLRRGLLASGGPSRVL